MLLVVFANKVTAEHLTVGVDACVLAFSASDRKSFDSLDAWREKVTSKVSAVWVMSRLR